MIFLKGYYFRKPRLIRSAHDGKAIGFGYLRMLMYWRRW
jgi:hypothetical protein